MKVNRVLSQHEQLVNADEMVWQYIGVIFDLMEEVLNMMEHRKELLAQIKK